MKILLLEDDEYKRRQVADFLHLLSVVTELDEARSLNTGLRAIQQSRYDLIILDMTMPSFDIAPGEDGGRPQAYAGREMLRHMQRRGILTPALVLTQFDRFGEGPDQLTLGELDSQLRREHTDQYIGAIFFDLTDEGWKLELQRTVESALGSGERP